MRKVRFAVLLGLLSTASGCEHGPPVTVPHVPQPPATASAALSAGARAELRGTVDLEAMDRLLTTLDPEDRARFLRTFQEAEWVASGQKGVETRDVTVTIRFADPERQRLLEHVWAPFWSHLPPAVLSDASYPLPGRMLAAARADSASAAGKKRQP